MRRFSIFVLVALLTAGCRVNRPLNDHAVSQTLYDSMPDAQKKNADQVFQSYGPTKPASQG